MVKVAWFVVMLFIIVKLMRFNVSYQFDDTKTLSKSIAEALVVGFLVLCAVIVTLDIVRWIYPILH